MLGLTQFSQYLLKGINGFLRVVEQLFEAAKGVIAKANDWSTSKFSRLSCEVMLLSIIYSLSTMA